MQNLIHKLLDHRIELMRHDAHLRREVDRRLSKGLKHALGLILAGYVENMSRRAMRKLVNEIDRAITAAYIEAHTTTETAMTALLAAEIPMLHSIYLKNGIELGMPKLADLAHELPLINGAGLDDWWTKQSRDTVFKFQRTVRQGMADGLLHRQISKILADEIKLARRHADTLVITATAGVSSRASEILRDNNRDILQGEQHLSTLDSRTSDICRARDNLLWDMDKKPVGHDIPYQRPPLHPRCRSVMLLVTRHRKAMMEHGTRASADGLVPAKTTYEDWLKSKSVAEQDDILGKGKAALWRDGKITMRDMLDQTGRPLTLEELKARY
ncbi:phage head morphogenesis protein [Cardiobacteriaceae bacterium TAE3-ERU3]|nr:phage head morphogenesis protein [Cardiobacteriaceae bacterium TAE3-ERU3]